MAKVTNSFTTYEATGNREDLIDVITNISPMDTWFTSNSGSTRAKGRYHEWQTDALAAAAENKVREGETAVATAITPTGREGNFTQILRKTFAVTDTQEAVDSAGRPSEVAYQTTKHLKELARDIEYALIINSASASGATGTARALKGVLGWIATNATTAATGTATSALTETILNNNLQDVWAEGGFPSTVLAGAFNKRTISGWSTVTSNTVRQHNIDAEKNKLVHNISIYESDFGTMMIRLHHQLNTLDVANAYGTVITLGDMSLWQKAWLRPVKREEMARTGAARLFMIEAELTLESRQEKGSGKITQTTIS